MGLRPLSDFKDTRVEEINDVDFESILQIAVLCTANSSAGRPTIDLIFDEMERVWRNTQAEMVSRISRISILYFIFSMHA